MVFKGKAVVALKAENLSDGLVIIGGPPIACEFTVQHQGFIEIG